MPEELPGNDCGVGLFPSTLIVKSDGLLLPPPSLTTIFLTVSVPVPLFVGGSGTNGGDVDGGQSRSVIDYF